MGVAARASGRTRLAAPTPEAVVIALSLESVCGRFISQGRVDQPHPVEDRDLQEDQQEDDGSCFVHGNGSLAPRVAEIVILLHPLHQDLGVGLLESVFGLGLDQQGGCFTR